MPKGHARDFIRLYAGILADVSVYHPTLVAGFKRDLSRLEASVKIMGESIFLLHLPAIGKVLDQSLDGGRLPLMCLPLAGRINTRTNIPRLFQGLWLRIFSHDGCLKADIDPNDVFFLRTLLYAGKKFRKECSPSATYAAVQEYYDVDSSLPPPSHYWDGDGSDLDTDKLGTILDVKLRDQDLEDVLRTERKGSYEALSSLQYIGDYISGVIGDFVPGDHRFRHGPGAVSDLRSGKGYKYLFPSWSPRLQHVFPGEVFALASASILGSDFDLSSVLPLVEGHSRLIAVPKTQKGPRLIACEPTCHQWAQQCVRDFLTDRIQSTFIGRSIDFRRQDLSGEMARAASLTGSHGTLDLSSASDRLSCFVIQRLFRKNIPLLEAMVASRTRYLQNTLDKKHPSLHKLRKFSSMGSALTFPVQSIVFYMVCVAAGISFLRLSPSHRAIQMVGRQVRVYGDDLIVPVEWMPLVEQLLTDCYLKVNRTKTFGTGKFRESCGTDAFEGNVVTPGQVLEFYEQSVPSSVISVVQVSNNLYKKGLWNAARALTFTIPQKIMRMIPCVGPDDGRFGLVSASGFRPSARVRWNRDLQLSEYLTFGIKVPKLKTRHEGFANLLQYFTEDPSLTQVSEWASGETQGRPVLTRRWVTA